MDSAVNPSSDTQHQPARSLALKSKVTNGKKVFAIGGDARGAWTRRWKDLTELHCIDLGGADRASEAQLSLIRRAAAITVQLEQMEARMSEGDLSVDLDLYNRLSGNLRRFFETLGVESKPRLIGDTLDDILDRVQSRRPVE
jgi:hypothetical protein